MSNAEERNEAIDSGEAPDAQGNVDKIRDILFGGQMRDYERRFEALEKRIVSENRRLADDLTARFEQLDKFMRAEFEAHTERLAAERKERVSDFEDQANQLAESRKALENKIADVDDSLASAAQDIRNRLHEQGGELLELIRRSKEELSVSLNEETSRLSNDKVAREDLAALLQEVALRLNREFDLPGED